MLQTLVVWLVVGGLAGWIAGLIIEGYGFGVAGNVVLGSIGSLLAGATAHWLGFSSNGVFINILSATIGALAVLGILDLARRL